MNRTGQQSVVFSLFTIRQRLARPLAGLMALLFLLVFVAATWHEDLEPTSDGSPRIAFHSFGVPEPVEIDPRTAGLPGVSVPLDDDCPLCLWNCAGKTVPGVTGAWEPLEEPVPERPAGLLIDHHTPLLLTSLSCRAPPGQAA